MDVFDHDHPWSIRVLAAVAVGGAVGASGRWLVFAGFEDATATADWPWTLLAVNLVGALLIGVVAGRLRRDSVAWSFVATGVLGGFTTFSVLAVELNDLADRDRTALAAVCAVVTVAGGWWAVAIGDRIGGATGAGRRRRDEPVGGPDP